MKTKEELKEIKIPIFFLILFIISLFIGYKIGWVSDNNCPTMGLFGLLASLFYADKFYIYIKIRRKNEKIRNKL